VGLKVIFTRLNKNILRNSSNKHHRTSCRMLLASVDI